MANLNLLIIGLLVAFVGGSAGLLFVLLLRQELLFHRRPRVIIAFVLGFTALCLLLHRGISGFLFSLAAAVSFFVGGLIFRAVLLGSSALPRAHQIPRRPLVPRWRFNVIDVAKLIALLVFLTVVALKARRNEQSYLLEQESDPSYLDSIESIQSDID